MSRNQADGKFENDILKLRQQAKEVYEMSIRARKSKLYDQAVSASDNEQVLTDAQRDAFLRVERLLAQHDRLKNAISRHETAKLVASVAELRSMSTLSPMMKHDPNGEHAVLLGNSGDAEGDAPLFRGVRATRKSALENSIHKLQVVGLSQQMQRQATMLFAILCIFMVFSVATFVLSYTATEMSKETKVSTDGKTKGMLIDKATGSAMVVGVNTPKLETPVKESHVKAFETKNPLTNAQFFGIEHVTISHTAGSSGNTTKSSEKPFTNMMRHRVNNAEIVRCPGDVAVSKLLCSGHKLFLLESSHYLFAAVQDQKSFTVTYKEVPEKMMDIIEGSRATHQEKRHRHLLQEGLTGSEVAWDSYNDYHGVVFGGNSFVQAASGVPICKLYGDLSWLCDHCSPSTDDLSTEFGAYAENVVAQLLLENQVSWPDFYGQNAGELSDSDFQDVAPLQDPFHPDYVGDDTAYEILAFENMWDYQIIPSSYSLAGMLPLLESVYGFYYSIPDQQIDWYFGHHLYDDQPDMHDYFYDSTTNDYSFDAYQYDDMPFYPSFGKKISCSALWHLDGVPYDPFTDPLGDFYAVWNFNTVHKMHQLGDTGGPCNPVFAEELPGQPPASLGACKALCLNDDLCRFLDHSGDSCTLYSSANPTYAGELGECLALDNQAGYVRFEKGIKGYKREQGTQASGKGSGPCVSTSEHASWWEDVYYGADYPEALRWAGYLPKWEYYPYFDLQVDQCAFLCHSTTDCGSFAYQFTGAYTTLSECRIYRAPFTQTGQGGFQSSVYVPSLAELNVPGQHHTRYPATDMIRNLTWNWFGHEYIDDSYYRENNLQYSAPVPLGTFHFYLHEPMSPVTYWNTQTDGDLVVDGTSITPAQFLYLASAVDTGNTFTVTLNGGWDYINWDYFTYESDPYPVFQNEANELLLYGPAFNCIAHGVGYHAVWRGEPDIDGVFGDASYCITTEMTLNPAKVVDPSWDPWGMDAWVGGGGSWNVAANWIFLGNPEDEDFSGYAVPPNPGQWKGDVSGNANPEQWSCYWDEGYDGFGELVAVPPPSPHPTAPADTDTDTDTDTASP